MPNEKSRLEERQQLTLRHVHLTYGSRSVCQWAEVESEFQALSTSLKSSQLQCDCSTNGNFRLLSHLHSHPSLMIVWSFHLLMVDVIDGIRAPIDMYRANDTLPTGLPKDRATDAEDVMQEDFPNSH